MDYTEEQLREIARGKRLHGDTKMFVATAAFLLAMNLIFPWDNFWLTGLFVFSSAFSYLRRRLDAISHFMCGNTESTNFRQVTP